MSIRRNVLLGIVTLSTTLLATLKPDSIVDTFWGDTVITAGEHDISCRKINYGGKGGYSWISIGGTYYRDSTGRVILKKHHTSNWKTGLKTNSTTASTIDDQRRIITTKRAYNGSYASRSLLVGETWNDKGMITEGVLYYTDSMSLEDTLLDSYEDTLWTTLTYDSTGINLKDTIITFSPDTVLLAGEFAITCDTELFEDTTLSEGEHRSYARYTDSLGRSITYRYKSYSNPGCHNHYIDQVVEIDSLSRIVVEYYKVSHAGRPADYKDSSMLVGETWNEQGMIVNGVLHKSQGHTYNSTYESTWTEHITIEYDSTGITPVDTLLRDPVSVISSEKSVNKGITFVQNNRSIMLREIPAGTPAQLISANGRVLYRAVSNSHGIVEMNLTALPAGIYFLKGAGKSYKILCQ